MDKSVFAPSPQEQSEPALATTSSTHAENALARGGWQAAVLPHCKALPLSDTEREKEKED